MKTMLYRCALALASMLVFAGAACSGDHRADLGQSTKTQALELCTFTLEAVAEDVPDDQPGYYDTEAEALAAAAALPDPPCSCPIGPDPRVCFCSGDQCIGEDGLGCSSCSPACGDGEGTPRICFCDGDQCVGEDGLACDTCSLSCGGGDTGSCGDGYCDYADFEDLDCCTDCGGCGGGGYCGDGYCDYADFEDFDCCYDCGGCGGGGGGGGDGGGGDDCWDWYFEGFIDDYFLAECLDAS